MFLPRVAVGGVVGRDRRPGQPPRRRRLPALAEHVLGPLLDARPLAAGRGVGAEAVRPGAVAGAAGAVLPVDAAARAGAAVGVARAAAAFRLAGLLAAAAGARAQDAGAAAPVRAAGAGSGLGRARLAFGRAGQIQHALVVAALLIA